VEYIHAGDCFQINLSQRLLAPLREHPLELYGRLRQLNPAPFAGYFDLGDFQILSASPERFLRVSQDGEVETRPIKGTRPRGATVEEDAALVRELAASAKDRAENVMIVDLLRNDIGKVCEFGSVRVPHLCEVESFRFVHHLVSEVRGKLRPGLGPLNLLAAAFPGGSVTGAPKVRAMEIIAELEPTARGPYCGSLGWIGLQRRDGYEYPDPHLHRRAGLGAVSRGRGHRRRERSGARVRGDAAQGGRVVASTQVGHSLRE
jgi:para-aminobenzoate synthetase component 1